MAHHPEIITVSEAWRSTYPEAHLGILALRGVANPPEPAALSQRKAALEQALRQRYSRADRSTLIQQPVLAAYAAYYKRFRKTYHIQLQLESIVFKGKALPSGPALVEAMFMAELSDLLLTAGHDLGALAVPLRLDVARGDEAYVTLRGAPETLKAGDMAIADQRGVISSIIYGPDQRTQITPSTVQVLFTTYAPAGVEAEAVAGHLQTLEDFVRLFSPEAEVIERRVVGGEDQG